MKDYSLSPLTRQERILKILYDDGRWLTVKDIREDLPDEPAVKHIYQALNRLYNMYVIYRRCSKKKGKHPSEERVWYRFRDCWRTRHIVEQVNKKLAGRM